MLHEHDNKSRYLFLCWHLEEMNGIHEENLGRMSSEVGLPTAVKPDDIYPGEHSTERTSPFCLFLSSIRCFEPPAGSPTHGRNIQ